MRFSRVRFVFWFALVALLIPLVTFGLLATCHAAEGSYAEGFMSSVESHASLAIAASYDWVPGGWDEPYSLGPLVGWRFNNRLQLTGGAKYVPNADAFEHWRSFIDLRVSIYGSP